MKVAQAQTEQADMTYAKQILAGKDLSKLEDQNAAVAEITKRSPDLGMKLMRSFGDQQATKNQLTLQQLQLYDAKNDLIGGALFPLKQKHDLLLKQPGATEQSVDQAMREDMFATIKNLAAQKLPDGTPLLNQQDAAYIRQNFQNGYNPGAVDALVAHSAKVKDAIALQMKERDETRKDRQEDRRDVAEQRAERNTESLERTRDRTQDRQDALARAKQRASSEEKLDPQDATALAQQYLAGDKSVFTGLGRGAQGPANIIAVRKAIRQEAEAQGMKPADIAARLAEYNGYTSEQRALGTQQANVEMASSEAQQMIQNARGASDDTAVARAHALGWNKIEQWTDKQLQGPENAKLASLKAATTAVINTWARAINPKGVATVADKEHGYELLNAAQDKATYDAVLDRFQQETEASLAAPASAKQRLHDAFISGQTPTPAPAPTGASLQPTPGRGAPAPGAPAAMPGGTTAPPKVVQWDQLN
jgi:hypothetical protein